MSSLRKKILVIVGTRPEAIKMAPLICRLKKEPQFETQVCVTAQHRELLDPELEFFGIKPDFDLDLMTPDQPLWRLTAEALVELSVILQNTKPDLVLVQGDTTSSFTGSLAAFYQKIAVGHVEAGLRTHNIYSPFPEEIYRRMISPMTFFHFAPTEDASQVLLQEGHDPKKVYVTGNTVVDSLELTLDRLHNEPKLQRRIEDWFLSFLPQARSILDKTSRLILVTAHRRESFGQGMEAMYKAVEILAKRFPHDTFLYPVHPNPNLKEPVQKILGNLPNVQLTDPVNYPMMVYLMKHAYLFLTDSGGIQEEAPSFGLPVLVMREKTERVEGLHLGISKLVGSHTETIVEAATELLNNPQAYNRMKAEKNPYGDGQACARVMEILKRDL